MLRHLLLSLVAVLATSASLPAAVLINSSYVPTPDLPGYATFTITASTNNGSQVQGFDFASQSSYGMFGPLNQVNPGGQLTAFRDLDGFCSFFFGSCNPAQDSQFLFASSAVVVPTGFTSESSSSLRSVFASPTLLGTSVPFVQLVLPPLAHVTGVGQIQTTVNTIVSDNDVTFDITNPFPPVPEPATIGCLGIVLGVAFGFARPSRKWQPMCK